MNDTLIYKAAIGAALCASLLACGGGDAGTTAPTPPAPTPMPTPTPPPAPVLGDLQGFWSASTDNASGASAVILPDGQVWIVYESAGAAAALARGALALNGASYTIGAKYYNLAGAAVQDVSLSGATPAGDAASLTSSMRVGAGAATTVLWTYNNAYKTPLRQSALQGRWNGLAGGRGLAWEIDAAGKLAGTSSTGCTYSGTLAVNPKAPAVLDAAITETCADATRNMVGIALPGADKNRLSLAYTTTTTTAAGAQGGLLLLSR